MILILFTASVASATCPNRTIEEAANTVAKSLDQKEFSCIRSIIINPATKFSNTEIDAAVLESLDFKSFGHKSYLEIIKNGVTIDYSKNARIVSAFYIMKSEYHNYYNNKQIFKKKFYLKKYFVCNFTKVSGVWKLTEDLCFTEGD